jgi:hypothetical protein
MAVSFSNEEQRKKLLTQLTQLRSSPGWKLLTNSLKELLTSTEKAIFTVGGNEVKYSDKDVLSMKREMLLTLLNQPDKLIADIMPQADLETEDFDPFHDSRTPTA